MNDRQSLELQLSARVDELKAAHARLGTADAEALHDLRVAVRRLRALLAPWRRRPAFRAVRRDLRALSAAMRGSGALRDREVRADWLRRLGQEATPGAAATAFSPRGLPAVIQALERHLPRALRRDDSHALRERRDVAARRLLFRIQCALGDPAGLPALPTVLHALRLDCKHLRYLLEGGAAPVLPALRAAQQALGDWRDLDRLIRELQARELQAGAGPGGSPRALAGRLAAQRRALLPVLENALQHLGSLCEADLS